jgi:hypothetical protein
MKILIVTDKDATQAKLILKPKFGIVKIPGYLSYEHKKELREKLCRIADMNHKTNEFLKLYYKIGTPYFFLNRKITNTKKETYKVYKYSEV